MCKKEYTLPGWRWGRGWQYVCIKANGSTVWKGKGNCARFCSPDNAMFETIEEVRRHHRLLLREMKEKEIDKKKMRLELEKRKKKVGLMVKKPKLTTQMEDLKPTIPQVLEKQKNESKKIIQSEPSITPKAKSKKRVERQKISTLQLQQFFQMKDYPIPINARTKKMWEEKEVFRKYYLPLVYIANCEAQLPLIETYVAAKWREVMAWNDKTLF